VRKIWSTFLWWSSVSLSLSLTLFLLYIIPLPSDHCSYSSMEGLEAKVVARGERLKRDVVDCGDNEKGYVELRQEKKKKKNKKECGDGGMLCCQAEKCNADLHEAKQYHRRHKVCECHAKAQVVLVHGTKQRFCQQCSRFGEVRLFVFLTFCTSMIRSLILLRIHASNMERTLIQRFLTCYKHLY